MPIYASTKTHNTDPRPWEATTEQGTVYRSARNLNHGDQHAPRPEYDQPRAHDGNPILIAARESWDHKSDPWGQALAWLEAVTGDPLEDPEQARDMGESWERVTVCELAAGGVWDLPQIDQEHLDHAYRVFDRMADVARALGLNY